jgi:hypothetical protein
MELPLCLAEKFHCCCDVRDLFPQSKAALTVYETILKDGTQKSVVPLMQTRAELYESVKGGNWNDTDRTRAEHSSFSRSIAAAVDRFLCSCSVLKYHTYEDQLDRLFEQKKK